MRTAVILYNLGGPCCLKKVKPFLFNLFIDKAIINLPYPFRYLLAKLISFSRHKKAMKIYKQIGGGSPILPLTYAQAKALEKSLGNKNYKVFTYMRYSYPGINDVIDGIKLYSPDRIVLLPLYPQYSSTTTASSIKEWDIQAVKNNINVPTFSILSYEDHKDFAESYAELLFEQYKVALKIDSPIVLFSAHGIPQNRIDQGDPYQQHIEKSVAAIVRKINLPNLEFRICYQSKVGPLKWLEPSTETLIKEYAGKGRVLILLPVAFVSEHSETLVELDIDYAKLAKTYGAKGYYRVPAVGTHKKFIKCLKSLVTEALNNSAK